MKPSEMKSLATPRFLYLAFVTLGQDIGLHWKDFQTLSTRFSNEGLPFLTKTLPMLSKAMLAGIGSGHFQLPSNFKRMSARSALPAFLGSLFAKVFTFKGALRPDADPCAIAFIRQFCEFAYKANLPRNEADDQAVVDRFVAVEEELASLVIDGDPILLVANAFARELFGDYDPDDLHPKHGPGVTANIEIVDKYEHRLTASLSSVSSFGKSFFFNENDAFTRLDRHPVWNHGNYFRDSSIAKVILVPKDSRGPRLISCEPAENQWVQQGIARYMVGKLESHWLSGGHVNFSDQSINRNLALEHSRTKLFSTLDLKDASDRVSMQLVRHLFNGTGLLDSLIAVRSNRTLVPDGRIIDLQKHAPMGSALCFPVMACSIYLLILAGLIGLGLTLEQAIASVYVYGDDIVIATPYARFTMDLLERYGLKVNRDKSFIDSPFLESCGMDAFNGNPVTPVRLRECDICPNVLRLKPKILVSLTETANLMAESGFERTSELLYSYCEAWLGPLPYGHVDSPYLHRRAFGPMLRYIPELNACNPRIRWRYCDDLQYNPLGGSIRAWFVRTLETVRESTFYGHLMRIWGQLGSGERDLPRAGVFTLPRQFVLSQGYFDHYSMMAIV